MPRIVLTLAEWRAIAHEFAGTHARAAPAGLRERLDALLKQAPQGWPEQSYTLDLDEASMEAVWRVHGTLTAHDPHAAQRSASVAEAMQIIRDHQERS